MTPFAVAGPYQVDLVFYYPSLNNPDYNGVGVATIGPTVEYPSAYYGIFSVNMKLRKMIITFLVGFNWYTYDGSNFFTGVVASSLTSGAYLPQSAYFISSTIDTSLMTLQSSTTYFQLNWDGVTFVIGDTIVIGW